MNEYQLTASPVLALDDYQDGPHSQTETGPIDRTSQTNTTILQLLAREARRRLAVHAPSNSKCSIPAFRQLSECIRDAILDGTLTPGSALPSMRDLSEAIGVSRSTVMRSFEDLLSQDYITVQLGSCARVREALPGRYNTHYFGTNDANRLLLDEASLSSYARRLTRHEKRITPGPEPCAPPPELVPHKLWQSLYRSASNNLESIEPDRDPMGFLALRQSYAAYLIRSRAARCSSDQVGVFFSRDLRLDLVFRFLLNGGDYVAVEDPCHASIHSLLQSQGAISIPIKTDHRGMCVDDLTSLQLPIKLVYVTPSRNEPTGTVMAMTRRKQLLEWAKSTGAFIIEDDFNSHYLYRGRPLPSLQGMDENDCVIHLSCFWQALAPLVKVGFMVLPNCLKATVAAAKALIERDMPTIEQAALSDLIASGQLDRLIRRNRKIYESRQQSFAKQVAGSFNAQMSCMVGCGGLEAVLRIQSGVADAEIEKIAKHCNLPLTSTRTYYADGGIDGEFIVRFALHDEAAMARALSEFAMTLSKTLPQA